MLRKLIYLPIPRHHKVFPKSNLGIFSSRSLPGRVEQDQAEEERPALQASSQLCVTFSIDEEYPRVFKVIQDYHYKVPQDGLALEVLCRQEREVQDQPLTAINVTYI